MSRLAFVITLQLTTCASSETALTRIADIWRSPSVGQTKQLRFLGARAGPAVPRCCRRERLGFRRDFAGPAFAAEYFAARIGEKAEDFPIELAMPRKRAVPQPGQHECRFAEAGLEVARPPERLGDQRAASEHVAAHQARHLGVFAAVMVMHDGFGPVEPVPSAAACSP